MRITGFTSWLVEVVDGFLSVNSSEPDPDRVALDRAAFTKVTLTQRIA